MPKKDINEFCYFSLIFFISYFLIAAIFLLLYVPFLRWLEADIPYLLPTISELRQSGKVIVVLTLISSIGLWLYQKMLSR